MVKDVAFQNYSMAEVRLNKYSTFYKRIEEFNWNSNLYNLNIEVTSYKQAKDFILQLDFKKFFTDNKGSIFELNKHDEQECDFLFLYPILLSQCSNSHFKKLEKKLNIHLIETVINSNNINSYYFTQSKEYCRAYYSRTENGVYSLNFNISNFKIDQKLVKDDVRYVNLNIIDIIMLTFNLKFEDAITKLCNYFGITITDKTKQKYLNNIEILKQLEDEYPFLMKYMKANKRQYLICFHEYAIEMSKGNVKNNHAFCFVHRNAKNNLKDEQFSKWSHTNHSRALRAFIKLGLLHDEGKSSYKSTSEYESPNLYSIPEYTDEVMKAAEKLAKSYKSNKIPFTDLPTYDNVAS